MLASMISHRLTAQEAPGLLLYLSTKSKCLHVISLINERYLPTGINEDNFHIFLARTYVSIYAVAPQGGEPHELAMIINL